MNNKFKYIIESDDLVALRTALKSLITEYEIASEKTKDIAQCQEIYNNLINQYQILEQKTRYHNLLVSEDNNK